MRASEINILTQVRVLTKPLFQPWRPWRYITQEWEVLSANPKDAEVFEGEYLIRLQDYYILGRLKYEEINLKGGNSID